MPWSAFEAYHRARGGQGRVCLLLAEGRVPYRRHRWELARLVARDEAELWPQACACKSRPMEVQAVYPHRDVVPRDIWLNFFSSAELNISVLDRSRLFIISQPPIMATLARHAQNGLSLRIGIAAEHLLNDADAFANLFRLHSSLFGQPQFEIQEHTAALNNAIYIADNELLVTQHVYGIAEARAPVLHLRRTNGGALSGTYRESFEKVWTDADR